MKNGTQDIVFAATNLGLLKSVDAGERWTLAILPAAPAAFALYSSADWNGHLIVRTNAGLFASKDFGDHWDSLNFPLPPTDVNEVAIAGGPSTALLAATRLGLYASSDDGATWSATATGLPASTVTSVVFTNTDGAAYAVEYGQLYQSAKAGEPWKEVPTAIPSLRIRQLWQPDLASGRLYGITTDLGILFRDGGNIR